MKLSSSIDVLIIVAVILAIIMGTSEDASACESSGWRVVVPLSVEHLNAAPMNTRLAASGYGDLSAARVTIPIPEFQLTCGRFNGSFGLLHYVLPVSADGPRGSSATFGGGSILPVEVGFVAVNRDGWEIVPLVGTGIGISYLTFSGPHDLPLPAGIYRSQGRIDLPLHLGVRITHTFDGASNSVFGYAEPGKQGVGLTLGLEIGFAATPDTAWYEDSNGVGTGPKADIPNLASFGPFAILTVGYGMWHQGKGPWR